ncbi:MAG: hypothetical protein HY315_07000 [Acidobacteria bacterium]|nr:hypothetical protein [Acidobacteriota bacterium]
MIRIYIAKMVFTERFFRITLLLVSVTVAAAPVRAQSDLAFPHIAVGGNPAFETVLQVINEVETDVVVNIDVFQGSSAQTGNGAPLPVSFDGSALTASRVLTLAKFQEFTTVLTVTDPIARNGWVRVRSTTAGGKISGNLLFRQKSGRTVVDSVGVSSPQRFRHAVIQVDSREDGSNTGVAFANPDSTPVTVSMDLFQGETPFSRAPFTQTLQPNQHFAKFVSEIFPAFAILSAPQRQATLLLETAPGRSIPYLTLRADGSQLTGIPVRPLGFAFQYEVRNTSNAVVETGLWMFDFVGFDLIGTGRRDTDPSGTLFAVSGNWAGTNFQFRYRITFPDNTTGIVIFNGTSAGPESTEDAERRGKVITGKVTTLGADGQVRSVNNFTAFHKFGAPAS